MSEHSEHSLSLLLSSRQEFTSPERQSRLTCLSGLIAEYVENAPTVLLHCVQSSYVSIWVQITPTARQLWLRAINDGGSSIPLIKTLLVSRLYMLCYILYFKYTLWLYDVHTIGFLLQKSSLNSHQWTAQHYHCTVVNVVNFM